MSTGTVPEIIRSILEANKIETGEALALRRWFYGDGVVHVDEAEAMFQANAALAGRDPEFNRLFIEILTDFVVYQQLPTGRVSAEQAGWLMDQMGGPDGQVETVSEIELLVNIMEEANEIPANLAAFALAQVKHAAITGEGPTARGRVHYSRTIDTADVDLLSRMLAVAGGSSGAAVTRAEADVLFDIADTCESVATDNGWERLFVRAIANHLLGSSAPRRQALRAAPAAGSAEQADLPANGASGFVASRLDDAGASWLASRIHRDGQVTRAERALLAFVNETATGDSLARAAIVRLA
jgi:hypothetical protein